MILLFWAKGSFRYFVLELYLLSALKLAEHQSQTNLILFFSYEVQNSFSSMERADCRYGHQRLKGESFKSTTRVNFCAVERCFRASAEDFSLFKST